MMAPAGWWSCGVLCEESGASSPYVPAAACPVPRVSPGGQGKSAQGHLLALFVPRQNPAILRRGYRAVLRRCSGALLGCEKRRLTTSSGTLPVSGSSSWLSRAALKEKD